MEEIWEVNSNFCFCLAASESRKPREVNIKRRWDHGNSLFFNLFCSSVFHGLVWMIGFSGIPFLFQGPQYNIDRLLNLKQFCMPLGRNSVWCTFAYFVGIPWRNHTNCSWVQLVCHSISHLPVVVASSYKSHQISDCKSLLFHRNTTTAWIGPVHLNCACIIAISKF